MPKLAACVEDWNRRQLAFVIQLGDLIDGRDSDEATLADLQAVLAVYRRCRGPTRHVLGNHDFSLPREEILARLGLDAGHDTFAAGGWRFVVLDSLDVSVCGRRPGSPPYREAETWLPAHPRAAHPNALPWNGGLGADQLAWLRATLARTGAHGERVIVFSHLPLLAAASQPSLTLWNAAEVRSVLEESGCVVACFAGHDHAGGYARTHGIHYVTLPGMVEAPPGGNAYAVVELTGEKMEIHGRGTVESRTLVLE
jgi:3',5'-cyclic AMP phosphodiesterase CpdA